jgi:hypothetical protein
VINRLSILLAVFLVCFGSLVEDKVEESYDKTMD